MKGLWLIRRVRSAALAVMDQVAIPPRQTSSMAWSSRSPMTAPDVGRSPLPALSLDHTSRPGAPAAAAGRWGTLLPASTAGVGRAGAAAAGGGVGSATAD